MFCFGVVLTIGNNIKSVVKDVLINMEDMRQVWCCFPNRFFNFFFNHVGWKHWCKWALFKRNRHSSHKTTKKMSTVKLEILCVRMVTSASQEGAYSLDCNQHRTSSIVVNQCSSCNVYEQLFLIAIYDLDITSQSTTTLSSYHYQHSIHFCINCGLSKEERFYNFIMKYSKSHISFKCINISLKSETNFF
jgi:hypothetical protein